jgi:hypothetical protein
MNPLSRLKLFVEAICHRHVLLLFIMLWLTGIVSSHAQQCTLPSRIFLPTPDAVEDQGLGTAIDIDGDYMVAGVQYSSAQQVYAGIAVVYKLGANNQWVKMAELKPSVSSKYQNFGSEVSIKGNTIVVRGSEFRDDGYAKSQLFVYDKPTSGEWISSSENYFIEKDFSVYGHGNGFGMFHLHGNELISVAINDNVAQLEIYSKVSGVFTIKQSINLPVAANGRSGWGLQVTDDYLAVNNSEFEHSDGSTGAVYIYEKNATGYNTTPIGLRSAEQSAAVYTAFGFSTAATNETLYVAGWINDGGTYRQTFYVFEKPVAGWANQSLPHTFKLQEYNYYTFQIAATNEYLFTSTSSYKSIVGVKKNAAGWSSNPEIFAIDDLSADTYAFGQQIGLSGDHLVVGAPARFVSSGKSSDGIVDYYSPAHSWNDPSLVYNQLIGAVSINATDDFFGNAVATNDDQIAIGASGDDDQGSNTGSVYIFSIAGTSSSPTQKIYCPEKENYTGFGARLAMSDSLLFISAPYKDSIGSNQKAFMYNIGKVYVYRLTAAGWKYATQIIAPALKSEMSFGMNVTCHGDYVAVTDFYTGDSESVGSVHIYKQDEKKKFKYLATLIPSTRLRSDFFGQSVVMNDSLMVIGTGFGTPNSSYRTSAYVFKKRDEWKSTTEDAELKASDGGWADRFATSVSMYGDYILVGAPQSPGFDPRPVPRNYIIPGAAYLYKKPSTGWKGLLYQDVKFTPSDPSDFGNFGFSVAIDHDDIFIGSPDEFSQYNYTDKFTNNDGSLQPGKMYHYKKPKDGWRSTAQEYRRIQSFEPEVLDGYGSTLFVSDRYLYVSAMLDDTNAGYRTGSVQTMMQLPVIDSLKLSCSDQSPVQLHGFPKGGQWSGVGINTRLSTFSPSVAGIGTHTIGYQVAGCQTSTHATVIAEQIDVYSRSEPEQTKCINKSILLSYLTSEDAKQYTWYFRASAGNAFSKLPVSAKQITVEKPGSYKVQVKRNVCPEVTQQFTVLDEAPVKIDIAPIDMICSREEVKLFATPSTGTWSGANVDSRGTINPNGLQNGTYKINYQVVTPVGCVWRDSSLYQVDFLEQPRLEQNQSTVCKNPVVFKLQNVDDKSAVEWYDAMNNIIPTTDKRTLTISTPGTYQVSVSKHGCSLKTNAVTLTALKDSLYVPNVFTANGDHINDEFEIRGDGLNNFYLQIFNRNGQQVFETRDSNFKWSAANVSPGVHFWRATYLDCSNDKVEQKGWVHVLKNE